MEEMKNAGIKTIYIEHLFSGHEQRMIDEFFKSKSEELKPALVSLFSDQSMAGMETLLRAAKHNGIRIQGIGTELAQVDTNAATDPTAKFNRVLLFNQHAADQIRKDQNSLDEDKRGFVVLAGTAHHIMHQGKTLNTPIKGLSQLLEMPVFEFDKNKKDLGILSVAPDMIWDPDVQTAKHISDFCKEKGVKQSERWQRGIVRTSLEELGKEEAASRKPMIGSHRAPEQTREGKQWQSAVPKRNERSNITIGRKR